MSYRLSARDEAGFTLAEYVAAIAIFLVVVVAAMSVVIYASTSNAAAARREAALNLAGRQIEVARNQPYDNLGVSWPGTPNPRLEGDYTVETLVSWARNKEGRATSRLVHVIVSWDTPRPGKVELQTQIFGLSNVPNSGDVMVRVVEGFADGSTKPLPGVYVELTPSFGGAQKVLTESTGDAFFGHVGAGVYNFVATKSGYAIDHSGYGTSPTIIAGTAPPPLIVTAYKESTYQFDFEMEDGSAVPAGISATLTGNKITQTGVSSTPKTVTVADGKASFNALLPDNYSVGINLPAGYSFQESPPTNVAISTPDTHTSATITLVRDMTFVVTVTNDAGQPIPAANVQIYGPVSRSEQTDSAGVAVIPVTTAGEYTITATKADHVEASTTMVVVKGTDMDVSLVLERYGTLSCSYTGTSNTTLYVYDADGDVVTSGMTTGNGSPRSASFSLPAADYYYVSTKTPLNMATAAETGAVTPGQTTSVNVTSSN
ncbi:MAG: hypothetical protein RBS78_05930 [Coriobacteriia bacterium]|nr:hypothetical protein [Coriobacteriia bacterium]